MFDQASDLRQLVLHRAHTTESSDAPQLICVTGGRTGVGATTMALQLAMGLARDGRRTALVDADLAGGNLASLCGLTDAYRVTDVLAGSRTVHEALQLGPAGILVLGGVDPNGTSDEIAESAQQRLIAQLRGLHPHIDYVILDTGCLASRTLGRFWQAAHCVLLTTSPDTEAVMDAYGIVKQLAADAASTRLSTLVNLAPNSLTAADVQERLRRACRRFLGLEMARGGWVPDDAALAASHDHPSPLDPPQSATSRAIEQLVETLVAQVIAPRSAPLATAS